MTDLLASLRVDPALLGVAAPLVAKLAPLLALALASLLLVVGVQLASSRLAGTASSRRGDGERRWVLGAVHALLQVPLWVAALVSRWGDSFWAVLVGVVAGLAIALAAAQLGDALRNLWRARRLTAPFLAGLVWGGGFGATLVEGVWLEGIFWTTDHAVVARCVREQEDVQEDQNGNKTYYWVYVDHEDVVATDGRMPAYAPGCAVVGYKERVGRERIDLFGGRFYSERRDVWSPFRWLVAEPRPEGQPPVALAPGAQLVRSNFYGRPIRDGVPVAPPIAPPPDGARPPLELDLPDPSRSAIGGVGAFFAQLAREEEFRPYAWFLLSLHLALAGALASPRTRGPALAFLLGTLLSLLTALILLSRGARDAAIGLLLSAPDVADGAVGAALVVEGLVSSPPAPRSRLRAAPLTFALAGVALVASVAASRVASLSPLRDGLASGVLVHRGPYTLLVTVALLAAAGLVLEWRVRPWLFALVFAVGGVAALGLERSLGSPGAAGAAGAVGALLGLAAALPPVDPRAHAPLPVSPEALAVTLCLVCAGLALLDVRGAFAFGHLLGVALGLGAGWAIRRARWEGWRRGTA